MKCDEYELLIGDMVDGEPWTPRSADLFAHMAECTECQRFLRHLLKLRNIEADSALEEHPGTAHRAGAPVEASHPAFASPRAPGIPSGERRMPGRPSSGILRRQIRISVSSAAVTLVMLVVWTLAVSFTLMRGENSGGEGERGQFRQNSMPSALVLPAQDRSSPDSH